MELKQQENIYPYKIDYLKILIADKDYEKFVSWYCTRKNLKEEDLLYRSHFTKECIPKILYRKEVDGGKILTWYNEESEYFFWKDFIYLSTDLVTLDWELLRLDVKLDVEINYNLKCTGGIGKEINDYYVLIQERQEKQEEVLNMITSKTGTTLYLNYKKGKARLYSYNEKNELSFELEWTKKWFLKELTSILKSDNSDNSDNIKILKKIFLRELEGELMKLSDTKLTRLLKKDIKNKNQEKLFENKEKDKNDEAKVNCLSLSLRYSEFQNLIKN